MTSFLQKSRNTLSKTHGWDVELTCSGCGFIGQPRYEGWSASLTTNIPDVNVFAKVACPKCGRRLTEEAGGKLVGLFQDVDIPEQNKKVLGRFIKSLILVPFVLAFILFFGTQMDWWGWGLGSVWILLVSALSLPLLLFVKNNRVAEFPMNCDCGKPHHIYMGALESAHCYRCYSCGRLLKVRE